MNPYEQGRHAGLLVGGAINPHPKGSLAAIDWDRGCLRETSARKRAEPKPARRHSALIHPLPIMTGEQIDLLCRREGLALAHLGRERFVLIQTANRPQTMLRIAVSNPQEAT